MSTWKRGGNHNAVSSDPAPQRNTTSKSSGAGVDNLAQSVTDISLNTSEDGKWEEVYSKKSKNRGGSSAPKQQVSQTSVAKAWGNPNATVQKLGLGNISGSGKGSGNTWSVPADSKTVGRGKAKPQLFNQSSQINNVAPRPIAVPSPVKQWDWSSRAASVQLENHPSKSEDDQNNLEADESDEDTLDDSDDDGFDSDSSQKSHDSRKKNQWFMNFFECLDSLSIEEINEPERQWHCPACKGGPGAIDWYRGLQPLLSHAKTKGSKRMKLHRELAELLEEELRRRGTSAIPAGEIFGKWKGLNQTQDKEIVWPPMVMIMNTILDKDENDKWIGMGNEELLDYFNSFAAEKARHSYGPKGHRGISVLIFEASAVGYLEAERLSKHFTANGRDRDAWEGRRTIFFAGGERQLYGFMADERDLIDFNKHTHGKTKLRFDMRSKQELVVDQLKQMSEENQLLAYYKNKAAKEQRQRKAIEESLDVVTDKLRQSKEEHRLVKMRAKMHHEQNKEEMDNQEKFFGEQLQSLQSAREEKEETFEKLQQEQRDKIHQFWSNPSLLEDPHRRAEEIPELKAQDRDLKQFVCERDLLFKNHEARVAEMTLRFQEERVALENEFDAEFNRLMEKYKPRDSAGCSSSGTL